MRRRLSLVLAALLLCLLCAGCASFLERDYVVREPHVPQKVEDLPAGDVPVDSKNAVKSVIMRMISNGIEQRVVRAVEYSGDFSGDIDEVLYEVKETEPLAAYAVSHFSYTESKLINQQTATINIRYLRDIADIQALSGTEAFRQLLTEAHLNYTDRLVLDFPFYDSALYDAAAVYDALFYANPAKSMERPELSVTYYPELTHVGAGRIVEYEFVYTRDKAALQAMSRAVENQAQVWASECPGTIDAPALKVLWLYTFLCDRVEYDKNTAEEALLSGVQNNNVSHNAYGALINKQAVSDGYAMAFMLLSKELGLDARVVKGRKNKEEYFWNVVELHGHWYHLDITEDAMEKNRPFTRFLKSDGDMKLDEQYNWDASKIPAAPPGPLDYETVLALQDPPADNLPEDEPPEDDGESTPETD